MKVSVVIRTYNEARHLPELLRAIESQKSDHEVETVIVDSGSTDGTLQIAEGHGARLVHIKKEDFSFGRSLNVGCDAADGELLVFISGHCIPVEPSWVDNLVEPLAQNVAAYSYGRQQGNDDSRFSERQIFRKYFPTRSAIPQEGYFVNNANSALRKDVWTEHKFDEELSGLEDMALGRDLVKAGLKIAYVADASVYHLHAESWSQVNWRYQREAIALRNIMPEVHVSFADFVRYYTSAVMLDFGAAIQDKRAVRSVPEVLAFRLMQFWGSYRGNNEHRKLSRAMKEKYFYPK